MRKIPLTFSLYDNSYGGQFPDDQYFVILFDAIPSKFSTKKNYSNPVIGYLKSIGFIEESRVVNSKRYTEGIHESLLIHKEKNLMINTQMFYNRNNGMLLEFLYNIKNGELGDQIDLGKLKDFQLAISKSNIQLVRSEMGHLDTEEYDLPVPEFDLELNYGKDFVKLHDLIIKRLNTPGDKGIIILYGEHGTGKTTYIKSLTKLVTDKDILFIPPSMAEMLSEPSIIPFLMDHRNSILIIEDSEQVIGDRRGKVSSAGVSNILNLTDGILGDCLNIQVIATCNIPRERIDPALLRKGRLICEHRFDKLKLLETNNLLLHLNKGVTSKVPLTLADIYNIDTETYRDLDSDPIGFKTPGR
jgi:energy-coupling factor transporter ATP-binding protein EcfA2